MSPIPITKGQRIDRLSERIIKDYCKPHFNCVDVGAHKGDILDIIINAAPSGQHFAFEPLPHLFSDLLKNYPKVKVFNAALADYEGSTTFQYVKTNPAYSGIKLRRYEHDNEKIEEITVELRRLDDCIPVDVDIRFIKIDVEGAELLCLKGASRILRDNKPLLLFEHGLGGADNYQYGPKEMYQYLIEFEYNIYTLSDYIKGEPYLSLEKFTNHFDTGDEFYFVAES